MSGKLRFVSLALVVFIMAGAIPAIASANNEDLRYIASDYMAGEVQRAQALGLIPDALDDADFRQPVTRAEFASLLVLMCETYTGVSAAPLNSNPFTDSDDPYVLKAYNLGLMQGTNEEGTLFSPDDMLDRETVVFMLYRAVNLIAPLSDYAVRVSPVIPDQDRISPFAAHAVNYMYSRYVVFGGDGLFMPRPVTDAEKASNYGIATREQCVALVKRLWDKLPEIENSRFSYEDKAAEILTYAIDEPREGEEMDRDELIAILRQYSRRIRWADNMTTVHFTGDFRKTGDGDWEQGYDSALLYDAWSSDGLSQHKYDEETYIWGGMSGESRFSLAYFDSDLHQLTVHEWNTQSDTGIKVTMPAQSANWFTYANLLYYMPGRLDYVYKLYDDAVINGERCKVFSVTRIEAGIEDDAPAADGADGEPVGRPPQVDVEVTEYFYVSTVSGICVLQSLYGQLRDTTYLAVRITFKWSPSLTDAGQIEPPADITFDV